MSSITDQTPTEIVCKGLESPTNGIIIGKKFLPNHDVYFMCNSGLELIGRDSLTCGDDGTWNGTPPVCEKPVNFCDPNPCQNDAICSNDKEKKRAKCKCTKKFYGKKCQKLKKKYRSVSKAAIVPPPTEETFTNQTTVTDAICVTVSIVEYSFEIGLFFEFKGVWHPRMQLSTWIQAGCLRYSIQMPRHQRM